MKKISLVTTIFLLVFSFAKASHIVGGDFQINMVSQNATGVDYHIKLRVYRDDVNGINMPTTATVGVYDALTHAQVGSDITLNKTNAFTLVALGDPCYTPDPNVVRIEEGIFETSSNITLPNNANGYYISGKINARNALAINVQTGGTMTWFAMIPDPALGQNSSPDFGNYPPDAYFCTSSPRLIQFPVTDADGDSLVYSLVEPLDAWNGANGTEPGAGAYPFYPALNWQFGYSLANIVGGTPPMSINPTTGVIFAAPTAIGFFTFAIRVEEFRNGVKIGETRRDVQYASLNCTSGSPPQFLNTVPTMGQTVQIEYNKEYCKDVIFDDLNTTDTLYIELISPVFDSGAYLATLTPDINGDLHYFYDWNGSTWNDSVVIPPNQSDTIGDYNIGTVAQRFCWTPQCDELFGVFPFQVNAFSLGCDGKSQDSILFNLEVIPPPANLYNPVFLESTFGSNRCVDITFQDSNIVDVLKIDVTSDIFDFFNAPGEFPSLPNNHTYWNGAEDPVVTGVPNNTSNQYTVATEFCWTPDCEHIGQTYNFSARLYSVDCPEAIDDTIEFDMGVLPPFDSLDVIPNVITPNGDGLNDSYTLGYINDNGDRIGGTSNPCTDELSVKIFNRWGILVFESEVNPIFEWKGTYKGGSDVPDGTYFILLEGVYGNEKVPLKKRTITVLRGN